MEIPCPAPPFQSISLHHCPLRCSELILTCTGGPGSSRPGLCAGSLMPTMLLHPPNQQPPPGAKPGRPPDHQGHIPRSSLCFGRSGVCPRWRPTLWPVGGAHRHHMAVPLAVRAGSCRGLEWTGSWERIRDSLQGKDSSHWTQKVALSPYQEL